MCRSLSSMIFYTLAWYINLYYACTSICWYLLNTKQVRTVDSSNFLFLFVLCCDSQHSYSAKIFIQHWRELLAYVTHEKKQLWMNSPIPLQNVQKFKQLKKLKFPMKFTDNPVSKKLEKFHFLCWKTILPSSYRRFLTIIFSNFLFRTSIKSHFKLHVDSCRIQSKLTEINLFEIKIAFI